MLKFSCCFIFRALCLKFPKKHMVMMNFLSQMLREEVTYVTCISPLGLSSDD